jgi:hypothetical protein
VLKSLPTSFCPREASLPSFKKVVGGVLQNKVVCWKYVIWRVDQNKKGLDVEPLFGIQIE